MKNVKTVLLLLPAVLLLWGCNPAPQPENVTVTFDAAGGSPTPSAITVEKGAGMGTQYPANPSKTDYTFEGWFNGTSQFTSATVINDNITLTAQWKKVQVTITFDADGGSPTPPTLTIDKGSSMGDQYPADPEKPGNTLSGWYDGTTLYTRDTTVNSDITLTAQWTAGTPTEVTVTVTFNADGGSPAPPPLTLDKGASMGDKYPTDPEKPGNTFSGWYNGDTQYTDTTPIHNNITLTAQWTALPPDPIAVAFTGLSQNGSASVATTKLTLTFDKDIAGLTTADITLSAGTTGASKGALSRTGTGVYDVALSGITANGSVTVSSVTKSGYTVTGTPRSVNVFAAPPAGPVVTPVTGSWKDLSIPARTTARQYSIFQGKTEVLNVAPNASNGYDWTVLSYSLSAYAGKEITISLSMDVWLDTAAKVAWQAQLDSSYPLIAGSTSTPYSAGQWHTISGSNTITVPAGGGTLYLSSQQLGENEVYITNVSLTITETNPGTVLLTMFAKQDLKPQLGSGATGKTINWTSSADNVATVTANGIVTAVNFTTGGTSTVSSEATGTATITAKSTDNAFEQTFTVTATMESLVNMVNLPPMKDQFADYFMIGNIGNGASLQRHYNIVTSENGMKPDQYGGNVSGTTVNGLTFTNPNSFVNTAISRGFKVHGHVLLWHSQVPQWQRNIGTGSTSIADATAIMKDYITKVVTNFKGKIYSWDVLNEVFPDGVSASDNWKDVMRTTGDSQNPNPWYQKIGADFVFEGFKAARLADPDAILYYNDYNMDNTGKATMVRDMVQDVNEQWATDPAYDGRLLIEGIGMQSHHNTNVSASSIRNSINLFRPLGVKISISELDVLCGPYASNSSYPTPQNSAKLQAANLYGQYFDVFFDFVDIIERVTFWGLVDSASWRNNGLPLPFDGSNNGAADTSRAKPAYYKIIEALEAR